MTPQENRRRIAQDYCMGDKLDQWWMLSEAYKCDHPAHRKKTYYTSSDRQEVCLDCGMEYKRKKRGMEPAYV